MAVVQRWSEGNATCGSDIVEEAKKNTQLQRTVSAARRSRENARDGYVESGIGMYYVLLL